VKSPVSACLVVKDEPLLAQAVASVRPYVLEVCILDSSTDPERAAEARALADRYEREDEGIQDWSVLRARSFALATNPWVLWLDADDEVTGLERLGEALQTSAALAASLPWQPEGRLILCPYEYAFDEEGRCTALQRRERLVYRPDLFHWEHPAHETLASNDGRAYAQAIEDRIVWKHRRTTKSSSGRARRVLSAYAEAHPEKLEDDAWLLANLGYEHLAAGHTEEARGYFAKYVTVAGDCEAKALAEVKLCDFAIGRGAYGEALAWARSAKEAARWLLQPAYAIARALFLQAILAPGIGGAASPEELAREAYGELDAALARPRQRETSQGVNPRDRFEAHGLAGALAEMVGEMTDARRHAAAQVILEPANRTADLRHRDLSPPRSRGQGRSFAFVCPSAVTWNPQLAAKAPVFGSELAVLEVARRLAARGHDVQVFTNCGAPGLHDGVAYRELLAVTEAKEVDVLVAWRVAAGLQALPARAKVLWAHDLHIHGLTPALALEADRVLGVSAWHARHLAKRYGLAADHVGHVPNGIDVDRFRARKTRNPHRAIYASSPDRGLARLLDLWPRIRDAVPDAELAVYYGFEGWKRDNLARKDAQHSYLVANLEERLASLPGVTFHGRVSPAKLSEAMLAAGVWTYPTWFEEASCMVAMEAQAAGLRLVTSRLAALEETVCAGILVEGDCLSSDYGDAFVAAVAREMRAGESESDGAERALRAAGACAGFSWELAVTTWEKLAERLLSDRATGYLPPYEPVPAREAA
jgi:glycosyltransferase involved in cell wall biosynthesis